MSIENHPRWPHNVEGYLLLLSDYQSRAGQDDASRATLERIQRVPAYDRWPYALEVESRLEETDREAPAVWMDGQSCQVCHREG